MGTQYLIFFSRSHARQRNACLDAPRRTLLQERKKIFFLAGRGASMPAFPRRAWEREKIDESLADIISSVE